VLVLITLTPGAAIAIAFMAGVAGLEADRSLLRAIEISVMVLQAGGVTSLIFSRLAPESPLVGSLLLGAQLGLGVAGSLCAVCGSDFALFAGATLGALLVVFAWDDAKSFAGHTALN
jgi:hypothetical protein